MIVLVMKTIQYDRCYLSFSDTKNDSSCNFPFACTKDLWVLFLQLSYNGKTIRLPFNFDILDWAIKTRQLIANAKLPDGVSFYNIYGTSLDTPFDVWYVTKLLLENSTSINQKH